jgi:hypothetical protein
MAAGDVQLRRCESNDSLQTPGSQRAGSGSMAVIIVYHFWCVQPPLLPVRTARWVRGGVLGPVRPSVCGIHVVVGAGTHTHTPLRPSVVSLGVRGAVSSGVNVGGAAGRVPASRAANLLEHTHELAQRHPVRPLPRPHKASSRLSLLRLSRLNPLIY